MFIVYVHRGLRLTTIQGFTVVVQYGPKRLNVIPPEAKSKVSDWGIKSTLAYMVKVDSDISLPIVNVLESTLEWT